VPLFDHGVFPVGRPCVLCGERSGVVCGERRGASRVGSHAAGLTRELLRVAALLVLVACSTPTVRMVRGPREYIATDYDDVLKRWTRSQGMISLSALGSTLTATATYESWDFRWAYVTRYAQDYRLTVDQRHRLLREALGETDKHHQFYVALYAQKLAWGDLNAANPAWIVRLVDDQGNETAPVQIERIRRPAAIELTYFPYTTPWRTCYRLRFPVRTLDGRPTIAPSAAWFGLKFAGAQGNQRLFWKIDRREERAAAAPDIDAVAAAP
jgi:hypothetical protein